MKSKQVRVGDVFKLPPTTELKETHGRVAYLDNQATGYGLIPDPLLPDMLEAEYVVESAGMSGGGSGHGRYDDYPDGWGVRARRLESDGSYNPNQKQIFFYQSGCFNCVVEEVEVVRKMKEKKTFV